MEHKDFAIGKRFFCSGQTFLCTDVGTRIATAVSTEKGDDWLKGPPYALAEIVFDENDFPGCFEVPEEPADDGFNPDWYSPPGDTVASIMEEQGIRKEDLVKDGTFTAEELQELLTGDLVIDDPMALRISLAFGGSPLFWARREETYRKDRARIEGKQ